MVGIYLAVFALEIIRKKITKIETDEVATGFANKLGNKGAVFIRVLFEGV